jgi:dCTP deaminase
MGLISGKSSWARRGINVESAHGVHPRFSGCLTLEIANVGVVPVELVPGMQICQLFILNCDGDVPEGPESTFAGRRKPSLAGIRIDDVLARLQETDRYGAQ